MTLPLRYAPYESTVDTPSVVVDGSPNAATVLTLTHWPQIPQPDGLADDLSARMTFRYLDRGADLHGRAELVTNNHFDQDGLVGVWALTHPSEALARRALLEDVAAAGDFAVFTHRRPRGCRWCSPRSRTQSGHRSARCPSTTRTCARCSTTNCGRIADTKLLVTLCVRKATDGRSSA